MEVSSACLTRAKKTCLLYGRKYCAPAYERERAYANECLIFHERTARAVADADGWVEALMNPRSSGGRERESVPQINIRIYLYI